MLRSMEKVDAPLYRYRRHRTESISSGYGTEYLDLVEAFRRLGSSFDCMGIAEANRDGFLRLHLTHLVAGRYPDLFLRAHARVRSDFMEASFALLDARFSGWRQSDVCRTLWPNPLMRAASTHAGLLRAFCRLPRRLYLGALAHTGGFDPSR